MPFRLEEPIANVKMIIEELLTSHYTILIIEFEHHAFVNV